MKRLFADIRSVDQIDLPELGIWIKVRKELSIGERRRIFEDAYLGQTDLGDGKTRHEYNVGKLTFGLTSAHITDWNATREEDGKVIPVPYSVDALKGLTGEAFEIVERAVDKYTEESKKRLGEATPSTSDATTSSSVSG